MVVGDHHLHSAQAPGSEALEVLGEDRQLVLGGEDAPDRVVVRRVLGVGSGAVVHMPSIGLVDACLSLAHVQHLPCPRCSDQGSEGVSLLTDTQGDCRPTHVPSAGMSDPERRQDLRSFERIEGIA